MTPLEDRSSKHTAGEWHVDPTAPEAFYQDVNVLRHSGLAVAVALHNGDIAPAEVAANARLIAAAPAMYEALRFLFDDYKQLADSGDAGFWRLEETEAGKKALAALSQAEASKKEGGR